MSPLANLQDLQELKSRLLQGLGTVKPHATKCLEGTRISILADVDIKTNDCDSPNIVHIYGAPGSGKSSISLTAKSRLHSQGRLITYFRFDRNETATTTPTSLWCHVAYDLARLFPSVLSHLLQQLRSDKVELDSPMDIFSSFVEDALSNIPSPIARPLVIIIDALDECGGLAGRLSSDRQILLQTLERWARLPKHFKLLVTSRPEGDIVRALSSISTTVDIPSGRSITENSKSEAAIDASNDICMFLEDRFRKIQQRLPSLPSDWPGSETMSGMVHRAAGIFMWVTTAANFIDSGIDPSGRLRSIMEGGSGSSIMKPLYSLYSVVLEIGFREVPSGTPEGEILRSILGTMVLAKRPLVDVEYTKLPTMEPVTQVMLDSIRDGLRSVIAPGSLRFVHKSFDDFLLSEECPPRYAIWKDKSHYLLTKLCLNAMSEGLRFNICGLETSCLKNADVPDIVTKVVNGISPLLSYSCLFFADHLGLTPYDEYLMRQVREMMLDKLLFWFEAMSLLKEITRVSPSLLLILKWLHKSYNDKFKEFLRDARRFVGAFGYPIAQSAPHIYISALSFAPENSFVAKHFLPHYPWIPALATGKAANWPSCIFTSEQHRHRVNCVAFSADEEYFATGSDDRTVCIFDSETGNLISGPFDCENSVYSVCFDPNACQVWASCKDGQVICWDIKTGNKHLVIRTPHSNRYDNHWAFKCRFSGSRTVISAGTTFSLWDGETGVCEQDCDWGYMAFHMHSATSISPDGCYIALVTGQRRTRIGIWKVVNGSKIQGPLDSHSQFEHPQPISALSFSVDSKFAVSGSQDGTVLIWDASTGDTAGPPLSTGNGWVTAVAYSPNSHLLASIFGMVTIWNAVTHEFLGRLEGHTSITDIVDIALSRDGQRVLTASWDSTVRMWDLGGRCGVLATNANQTRTSEVTNVAFSPCGKKLASLDRYWIKVWDPNTGKYLFKCRARRQYRGLIFSPDGIHIVAYPYPFGCSGVWNANTGALVLDDGPSEDHVAFRSTDGESVAKRPCKIVALSPDGLTFIVYDEKRRPRYYVWSTTTRQSLPLVLADNEYISEIHPRTYSPSGRLFASCDESTVRVWDMRTGGQATRFSTNTLVECLAFSPDDRHIASSSGSQIWIFDASTSQLTSGPWSDHFHAISTLAFSPDGKLLASGTKGGQVRVWDVVNMLADTQLSLGIWRLGTHMEDGWVKDVGGKLLFWVPKDCRSMLVWPPSVPLAENETRTELDLSKFRYGESWKDCYSGGNSRVEQRTS